MEATSNAVDASVVLVFFTSKHSLEEAHSRYSLLDGVALAKLQDRRAK